MKKLLQVLNILGFIGVLVVNSMAVLLPLNNRTTEELSDMYPNLFVPAGLTFSIWGVIYVLLLLFTLYQAADLFRGKSDRTAFVERTGLLYLASSLFNIGWILAWHYEQVLLSVFIMLGLLVTLITLYLNIGDRFKSFGEKLMTKVPISVYLGWISVAIVANITALLVDIGWDGFGISQEIWTYVMMGAAFLLAVLMKLQRDDMPYGLVIIWALAGIAVKRFATEPFFAGVSYAAIAMAVLIAISFLLKPLKKAHKF